MLIEFQRTYARLHAHFLFQEGSNFRNYISTFMHNTRKTLVRGEHRAAFLTIREPPRVLRFPCKRDSSFSNDPASAEISIGERKRSNPETVLSLRRPRFSLETLTNYDFQFAR